jgi:hypothetical protein
MGTCVVLNGKPKSFHGPRLPYVTPAIATRSSHPATGGSHAPRVHMIKLTEAREITPYTWVSPTTVTAAEGILLASNSSRRPRNVSMAVSAGARCSAIAVGSSQPSARCNTSSGGTRRSGSLNPR